MNRVALVLPANGVQLDLNHPTQKLVFYVSDRIEDESDVAAMRAVVAGLGRSRSWVIAPPIFLNSSQDDAEAV